MAESIDNAVDLNAEIEAYKRDVDRTVLRENLKLSTTERWRKHQRIAEFAQKLRLAGRKLWNKR